MVCISKSNLGTFLAFLHVMSLVICPVADTNLHKGAYHKYGGNLTGARGYLSRVNLVGVKLAGATLVK